MPWVQPPIYGAPLIWVPAIVSGKKKKKGRATPVQDPSDPYSLIAAKTTAGHKAVWDGALGHYKAT
jgi:hypothetical protein